MSAHFAVGDLIFEQVDSFNVFSKTERFYLNIDLCVDIVIVLAQFISQKFYQILGRGQNLTWEDAKVVHVFQVVEITEEGDVLMAHATPSGRFKLKTISLWQEKSLAHDFCNPQ